MKPRRSLLLIEDEPADAELVRIALGEVAPDVQLSVAGLGEDGLAAARAGLPDLILLDLVLPDLSGLGVLLGLRGQAETRGIPVVVLSRHQDDENVWRAYQGHANAFMIKPMNFEDLRHVMDTTCTFWFTHSALPRRRA